MELTRERIQEFIDMFDRKDFTSDELDTLIEYMDEYLDKYPSMLGFFLASKPDRMLCGMVSARKTCHKKRFDNEHEATKWLKRMTTFVTNNGDIIGRVPQRTYECPVCHGFHCTSRER